MIEEKPWYLSKTIWGSIVAVAASLLSGAGISLDSPAQAQFAEAAVQLVGALGGLFAIYGRLSATDIIA